MELTKYSWWGESNEPPEHLKTKKQLAELGLSPLKPSGVIETRKYDVLLYDINNPECCRPKRKPTQDDWTILDTETTGFYDPQIVEIAIIDCTGQTLLDTFA